MNNDLISRAAAIEAVERREPMLIGDKLVSTDSFKNFLRNRPAVDAVPIVRCKDCICRGNSIRCPMCHEEYTWDEDYGSDYCTVDDTVDYGFCHCGVIGLI